MLDFKLIAATALASADSLVPLWLPDGKRSGHEWSALNPTRGDGKAGSFSVNLNSGVWADFATGDKGGDLVSLYAYLHGMGQGDAARALADQLRVSIEPNSQPAQAPQGDKRRTPWIASPVVPDNAPAPFSAHSVRGKPEMRWEYRRAGKLLGLVYRFRTSDGGKEVLPLVWATNAETGAQEWRWLAMAEPRPLYLPGGELRENAPVLVVEGEKCADAAFGDAVVAAAYQVVSWPGGSKAVGKVDWSWLAGRRVVIWPDCDAQREDLTREEKAAGIDALTKPLKPEARQPGIQAAEAISAALASHGCEVRIVAIPVPGEKPGGWDVADAVADGITGDALLTMIRTQRAPAASPQKPAQPSGREKAFVPHADWRGQLIMGKDAPRDCRENVIYVLRDHPEWAGALAIDTFAKKIMCKTATPLGHKPGDEWTPDDEASLGLWLTEQARFSVRSLETISQAVRHVALVHQVHPVREYFDSLEWDQRARCDRWTVDALSCEDTPYSRMVGMFFLINMVRRIYEPGCVMRSVPVFEGAQNKGKSRALWTLTHPWYSDTMMRIGDKDSFQMLQGVMCYEVSEMDSFTRSEASAVKAFISSTEDNFRAPYERAPTKHKRQTSFAATTNAAEYLKDWTGNTRFWPLAIGDRVDLDGLARDRDQLWAEAVQLYRSGERAYPTAEQERTIFKAEQDRRVIVHPWQEMVAEYVLNLTGSVTTREVMREALKIDMSRVNPQGSEAQRVGQILHGLGYYKIRLTGGTREWAWKRDVQPAGGSNDVAI